MTQQQFKIADAHKISLDSGRHLEEITIAYHTFGELNAAKTNVILICHPLTGSSNAMEWWPKIVGHLAKKVVLLYFLL